MCKQVRALTKNYLFALSLILGLGVISPPAHAVTISGEFLVDNDIGGTVTAGIDNLVTSLSIGDSFSTLIEGPADLDPNNPEGGGSIAFKFEAAENLLAIETSFVNPGDPFPGAGFTGVEIEWNSKDDGSGDTFASISDVTEALFVSFAALDTKFLIVTWSGIVAPSADFSLRVTAVPVPAAGLLFGSVLVGIGYLSRRRRKKQNTQRPLPD